MLVDIPVLLYSPFITLGCWAAKLSFGRLIFFKITLTRCFYITFECLSRAELFGSSVSCRLKGGTCVSVEETATLERYLDGGYVRQVKTGEGCSFGLAPFSTVYEFGLTWSSGFASFECVAFGFIYFSDQTFIVLSSESMLKRSLSKMMYLKYLVQIFFFWLTIYSFHPARVQLKARRLCRNDLSNNQTRRHSLILLENVSVAVLMWYSSLQTWINCQLGTLSSCENSVF